MKKIKATNLKGLLCKDIFNNHFIRIYSDNDFKDYSIKHDDIEIEIKDEDVYLYEDGDEFYIDYSLKTLGIKE